MSNNDKIGALNDLNKAYKLKPHIQEIWPTLVNLRIEFSEYAEALELLLELVKFEKISAEMFSKLAFCYTKMGKFEEAAKAYQKILQSNPSSVEAWISLAEILKIQHKLSDALHAYHSALRLQPKNVNIFQAIASILRRLGKLDEAIAYYQKALVLLPSNAEIFSDMAAVFDELGKFENALEAHEKAVSIAPQNAQILNNFGLYLKKQNQLEKALGTYKEALVFAPENHEIHNNIGVIYRDLKRVDRALDSFKKSLAIKPDFTHALYNMGVAMQSEGKYKDAIQFLDQVGSQAASAIALECTYASEEYTEFNSRLKLLSVNDPVNIRVAALSSFAAQQLKHEDPYPFCRQPLAMIHVSNIRKFIPDHQEFIASLLAELNNLNSSWEPIGKTTKGGFQTSNRLFSGNSRNLAVLEKIISSELSVYKEKFAKYTDKIIQNWPEKEHLSAWFVKLLNGGHQSSHIHPGGWVSGVCYLKTVSNPHKHEGAIKFGLHGYHYPIIDKDYPTQIFQPTDGDLILFPSSLFHETIPVRRQFERSVIAFDLLKN